MDSPQQIIAREARTLADVLRLFEHAAPRDEATAAISLADLSTHANQLQQLADTPNVVSEAEAKATLRAGLDQAEQVAKRLQSKTRGGPFTQIKRLVTGEQAAPDTYILATRLLDQVKRRRQIIERF